MKPSTAQGGRLGQEKKQLSPDPIDIDDDANDKGLESVEQQIRELDGMNKYLQNIRVPTKFAVDDYL